MNHTFSMSQKYLATYPDVGFGLTLISGCQDAENQAGFDHYKKKLLRKMRKRETLAQISKEFWLIFYDLVRTASSATAYPNRQIG